MGSDDNTFLIETTLKEKILLITRRLEIPDSFPGNESTDGSKFYENDGFSIFLRKLNILLSLQLFFSLIVIEPGKQIPLKNFVMMYMKTQNEMISLLAEMYYELDEQARKIVSGSLYIPRLEEEITHTVKIIDDRWTSQSSLSDKEMLGIVEQVGDSIKDPIKKVFGGVGDWVVQHFMLRTQGTEKWSAQNQGKINSGFKYLDEFANIAIRIAKGGL